MVGPSRIRIGGLPHRKSEEHTSELQSRRDVVCRLLLAKKKQRHSVTEAFEVTPALLDDFHIFLAEHGIQPSLSEWSGVFFFFHDRHKNLISFPTRRSSD